MWVQIDGAERGIYQVLDHFESSTSPAAGLFGRLSAVAERWEPGEDAPGFPDGSGTAVVHAFDESDEGARFEVFVASGISDGGQGWLAPGPRRVYTCYRLDVFIDAGLVTGFVREDGRGRDKRECPSELVHALGDGAEYRDPWVFDG